MGIYQGCKLRLKEFYNSCYGRNICLERSWDGYVILSVEV